MGHLKSSKPELLFVFYMLFFSCSVVLIKDAASQIWEWSCKRGFHSWDCHFTQVGRLWEDHSLFPGHTGVCWAVLGFLTALHSHLQCPDPLLWEWCLLWVLLVSAPLQEWKNELQFHEQPGAEALLSGAPCRPGLDSDMMMSLLSWTCGSSGAVGTVGWAASPPAGTGAGYRVGTHLQEQGLALLCVLFLN